MKKNKEFAILGLGRFGISIARSLSEEGCEVMAVDKQPEIVNEVVDYVTHAEIGDITSKEIIESLGLSNYDVVIIGIGDDLSACVMATILAKEVGAKFVLAKAGSELHARILRKVGADKVIFPELETGRRIARQLVYGNYFDAIGLSSTHSMMEVGCPMEWVGHTLKSINLRAKHGASVIAIKRGDDTIVNPSPDLAFETDDLLIMLGDNDALVKLHAMSQEGQKDE